MPDPRPEVIARSSHPHETISALGSEGKVFFSPYRAGSINRVKTTTSIDSRAAPLSLPVGHGSFSFQNTVPSDRPRPRKNPTPSERDKVQLGNELAPKVK